MANSGAKFVSANLNKSYGQQHQPSHYAHHSAFSGSSGSYGQVGTGARGRPGSGGTGMVLLSRNRVTQKAGPKLSVPPPLNLPSLRKEHERFDLSGPGGGSGGGIGPGNGPRPTSSGLGWTKPVTATASSEKNESSVDVHVTDGMNATDGLSRGSSSYLPISAQSDELGVARSGYPGAFPPSAERITVLRGEDFPSLQAARPVSSGTSQKQKDASNQKQKQAVSEETSEDKRDSYNSSLLADMRKQGQSSRSTVGNESLENGGEVHRMGSLRMVDHARKQEDYFPGPLPLVQFNPRSDWADDERDTGHAFAERGREVVGSKIENYWDRDFDLPRPNVLMQKPVHNQNHWSQRDNKNRNDPYKLDPYNRDLRTNSGEGREVNKWRTSSLPKNGLNSQEVGNDRYGVGARTDGPNNAVKDNKYITPHFGDTGRDGSVMVNRDSSFGRKDVVHVPDVRQQFNNSMEIHNNRDRYGAEQFNREKHAFSKGDKLFTEDPFSKDFGSTSFDEGELFSRDLVGAIKRKKDVAKPNDFHDPVRESFEAELERVQKMQELERQRIIEEQERALEQARREDEERLRRIREEEERQRRLEEEAREAAWREEQERLEAIRIAEEQRIAREEEKKTTLMEEERRKQAAKQKLLELEAMMAKRQSETSNIDASVSNVIVDDKVDAGVKEKDSSGTVDLDNWEDSERIVAKLMITEPLDSSAYNGRSDISSRPYPQEVASSFSDRGKSVNSWKRDMFENVSMLPFPTQDHEIGHNSPRRDAYGGGWTVARKEFYGGSGYMNSRAYSKAGIQEPFLDDFGRQKDHRWNVPGDVDLYSKNRDINSDFHDNLADKYGDNGLGQARSRSSTCAPYPERLCADELYPYGRSRHSMKQPRVLPPPLASSQRTSFRGVKEHPGPSAVLDNGIHYPYRAGSESTRQTGYYGGNQEALEASSLVELRQENAPNEDQRLKDISSRCDSQSSLSVSSPPNSPPHLSNDELDESGDSPVISIVAEGKKNQQSAIDSVILNDRSGNEAMLIAPGSTSAGEDEEWTPENDDELQQQEDYDEDEDGYQEEDEVRGGYDGNLDLDPKIEDLHLEDRDSSHILDNVVLGFDEGVEVVIPSDDFARNSGTKESTFGISGTHVRIAEEQGAINRVRDDEQSFLTANDSFGTSKDRSSRKVQETDKVLPVATVQPISAPCALSTSDFLYVDASGSSGLPAQQPISASGDVTSGAGEINMSSMASAGTRADVPVKLQFGLFSGPSLIPSPIPAIQIGSIQMPLHIHPPIGPSLTHVHPSQPPLFQFGQLRYTSPISQGILPMPHQSMSFVQPNMQAHYNLNQNAGGCVPNQPAEDASRHAVKDEVTSLSVNKQSSLVSGQPEQSHGNLPRELGSVLADDSSKGNFLRHSISSGVSGACDKLESVSPSVEKGQRDSVSNNYLSSSNENRSVSQLQRVQPSSKYVSGEKNFGRPRHQGIGGSRGRSGVVRVYEQPGIEAPSDEDDFIEVRSKRQMLIDRREQNRREQREKEIKAKSRVTKLLPKSCAPRQSVVVSTSPNKLSAPLARQSSTNYHSDFVASEEKSLGDKEVVGGTTEVSQPLAPIGTPALNTETSAETPSHAIISVQTEPVSVVSNESGDDLETVKMFENKNKILDNFQSAASTWGTAGLNQQVMALTQTQLEEAMKPARYDSHISVEGNSSTASDPVLASSSMLTKDKSLSSGASPINSLLAGERIQFGAVTSPTVLPPSSRVVSHGIGAPGSNRPDIQMSRNLSADEKDSSLFFEKEKHPSDSCVTLQDSEAEAEAAASAIAVAAISSDEIVTHGIGSVGLSDAKNLRGSDIGGIIAAVSEDQQLVNHSRCEESLSVSLPADLSVETTPISLWQPMPSPQSSTPQMLSRFPAGPPSHFPFYEMNPMLGGPIFAFGPCEDSSGTQSQPQNSTASSSGPPGTWQQCHSSLDSIYGPPAGYTGPFISPPGGIPGLQGPPHMVVYNHFAPVGQYGQVGLSFMGTTYIPSSKQSDWKHNPTSSAMHVGEGEMSSMNTTTAQRNASNMAAPVQHLAPGSPLLPIASPLTMFDASPFQSAPDLSFQVRWPHLPASPLHPLPLSRPLQQEADVLSSQVSRGHSIDQSLNVNRFSESRISTPSENDPTFSVAADSNIAQFPAELGLVGTLRSINSGTSAQSGIDRSSTGSATAESGKTDVVKNGIDKNGKHQSTNYLKTQPFPQKNSSTRQSKSSGYIYQRGGGMSQRNNAGNEWSYRRMGFHGRNQSSGAEKVGLGSKMKQIYVAKQTTSGSSNAAA
ncbi:unnamed protein product [Fraxinus pennsylvanica]|uniref:Uncharacterized protein n=1 Tax=Fraxinus pennsylvanica TaxID=56036 RepID=A0AAD1Z6K7_9LAMI|nr:unnamed protein product [Fraxinus pennsylvanica]